VQTFIVTLIICSVTMSVLALLYMVSAPFLAGRYSEKGRYYVWLIILLGLIIPFRPQFVDAPFSVPMEVVAPLPIVGGSGEVVGQFAPQVSQVTQITPSENLAAYVPFSLAWAWWQVAFLVWLVGVVVFILVHAVMHYRFAATVRRWSVDVTDERVLSLLEQVKKEMGITRSLPVYLCEFVGSPMMIGVFRPRILLPTVNIAEDELAFILKHELVHYRRYDLLYKYLVLAATALHWFNPVVYLIAKEIGVLCETSCDAEVLQSADMDTRRCYGETIIGVVQYKSKMKTALSTHFYGGKNGMNKRILSIMDTRRKKIGAILACVILVSVVAVGGLFAVQAGDTEPRMPDEERRLRDILEMEAEIEQQLVEVDGVAFADVSLAIPNSLREDAPLPAAAVVIMVEQDFSLAQGYHLAMIVARNVSRLEVEHVTIVDQLMRTVFPAEEESEIVRDEWSEWLEWFNSLPPELQPYVSLRPPQEILNAPRDSIHAVGDPYIVNIENGRVIRMGEGSPGELNLLGNITYHMEFELNKRNTPENPDITVIINDEHQLQGTLTSGTRRPTGNGNRYSVEFEFFAEAPITRIDLIVDDVRNIHVAGMGITIFPVEHLSYFR